MKHRTITRFLVMAICIALIAAGLPFTALAEETADDIFLTEGEVVTDFAPAGSVCTSDDPSIAWVDDNGCLNALKPGTVTITVPDEAGSTAYSVNVSDYSDGSDTVGSLKILARYNDAMQFYDGHVYLLFTSYQDGVEITVPDLYAGYEISDDYYTDIRENIANGSNHTGTDTDKYFTFSDQMKSVTLNRGEIVTIGMYRGFDLSVPQAALGSVRNSSLWKALKKEGKTAAVETIFDYFEHGQINAQQAVAKLKAVFDEAGLDYNNLLNGVVEGGVCFNRELYNQKLEWDQYENVTYEMDITRSQLQRMTMYLGGNLNHFSILKNSCATVALRAWNAAVGTRDGADTAYKLSSTGEGIFAVIDAPKGVRDNIVARLPGYYKNNAEGVAEPDAGYQDETGWVYVSAPEKVAPATYVYADDALRIDEGKTKLTALMNAAGAGEAFSYNKDEQEIGVSIRSAAEDGLTEISGVDFTANGSTVCVAADTAIGDGIWFKAKVDLPAEGEDYYVTDADGRALASEYEDGWVSFCAPALPFRYRVVGSSEGAKNILRTVIVNGEETIAETEVYTKNGEERVAIGSVAEVACGTKIFVRPTLSEDEYDHIVGDIALDGVSFYGEENYDAEEGAWFVYMPEKYAKLTITFETAVVKAKENTFLQLAAGETRTASDLAVLLTGEKQVSSDAVTVMVLEDEDGAVAVEGNTLTAVKEGAAVLWVCAGGNETIGIFFYIEVYSDPAEMAEITFDSATGENTALCAAYGDQEIRIPFSGYLVKKGAVISVDPLQEEAKAILSVTANGKPVNAGETVTVAGNTEISVKLADATLTGMPGEVRLAAKGDTCQLEPQVQYTGLYQPLPVYDNRIYFTSYDPARITVDETGLITVVGDIPEEGAVAYVGAVAGSSNDTVSAGCRVVLGDYQGDRIVGRLTISARPIVKAQLIAHGALTYTTYEDMELPVSFYHYYQPNASFNALMADYEKNPENYTADPALYNDNELGLTDRESYFNTYYNGAGSDPQTISLKAGESFTVSNYGYDRTQLSTIRKALEGGLITTSPQAQELVRQIRLYEQGEAIDGEAAFDSLVATLAQIVVMSNATGTNPADGHSDGGMDINREVYNQFRRSDSQMPNNYYAIDITADEAAALKRYLADPGNNYYTLFNKNCASGSVELWNLVLSDKPELHLKGNYTGLAADPESLYIDIGQLRAKQEKQGLDGEGGTDFYPRVFAYSDEVKATIEAIDAIGDVALSDACRESIDAARAAYDALSSVEKERVRNRGVLTAAEEAYAGLQAAANKEAFAAYQAEQAAAADALAREGDGILSRLAIAAAKAMIAAQQYDETKTPEENKAAVDAVLTLLDQVLKTLRDPDADRDSVILGDVDGDGDVTIVDATYIQRRLADLPVDSFSEAAADTDGDGDITVVDATYIQRWLVGLSAPDGIGQPVKPDTPPVPDVTEAPADPNADVAGMKTMGEVFAAYPETPYTIDEGMITGVVETAEHIYIPKGPVAEDIYDAAIGLAYDDPQYQQKFVELMKNVPITSCEDIKPLILPQEKLDQLVGKTGKDLFDMGFVPDGYSSGENGDLTVFFIKDHFEYQVDFQGKVNTDDENFDVEEACKPLTVSGAAYVGVASGSF